MNKVYIVGVGPGSPRYLTKEAEKAISEANIVVGWEFDLLPVRSLTTGKKVYLQDVKNYIQVAKAAADEARKQGETVAVLKIGDPCISSGLAGTLKVFHDFEVKIVPGISSIQLAAASAQTNIDESVIISFHEDGDALEEKRRFMLNAFLRNRHLIILTGQAQKPDETASYLIKNGVSETTPALVCEKLALEDERISRGTLRDVVTRQFSWLSVMVVICSSQLERRRQK
jgi:precorrin-6y C5,15-methyltransferase (decarboxylating) CbiE subunit